MAIKTREKLIEVARQLFARQGVANTTMNDIASASDKGRRTVYTYFKNKKEIYNAVLEEESDHMVESLREVAQSDRPVEIRLHEFLHRRLERYAHPTATASLMDWLKFDSRRIAKVHKLARVKENVLLQALLAEGIQKGVFLPDRCALLQDFLNFAVTLHDSQSLAPDSAEENNRAIAAFTEFVMTDILAK